MALIANCNRGANSKRAFYPEYFHPHRQGKRRRADYKVKGIGILKSIFMPGVKE